MQCCTSCDVLDDELQNLFEHQPSREAVSSLIRWPASSLLRFWCLKSAQSGFESQWGHRVRAGYWLFPAFGADFSAGAVRRSPHMSFAVDKPYAVKKLTGLNA